MNAQESISRKIDFLEKKYGSVKACDLFEKALNEACKKYQSMKPLQEGVKGKEVLDGLLRDELDLVK